MNIKDIARLAGVSTATVSRVINQSGTVKEETKAMIQAIIEEHHYVPNAIARSLCTQDTFHIGVVVPDISNEFFSEAIQGITEEVENHGLHVLLFNTVEDVQREHHYLQVAESENLKGVILTPVTYQDTTTRKAVLRLEQKGIPVVLLDRDMEGVDFDGVFTDNFQGAFDGVQALIDAGHRRIGIVSAPQTSLPGRERRRGYLEALRLAGIPYRKEYEVKGDFKQGKAYESTKRLLQLSNLTTLGTLKCVTESGLKLGRDISVLGYDGISILNAIAYPISTVERDARQQGKEAAKLLFRKEQSEEQDRQISTKVIIPHVVQLRGSEKISINT
jgi:LacI family transcriptional regulator